MVEARGGLRLAPEPLDELAVLRVTLGHDLERDLAAEARILGQVDGRHPADAEPPEHAVAAVERLAALGVIAGHWVILPRHCCAPCPVPCRICHPAHMRASVKSRASSTAFMTSRAIGAAACAAVLLRALDDDGDGDLRILGRGERDEPRVEVAVRARLRRAGLAGDLDAGDLRGAPRALVDDVLHHLGHLGRDLRAEAAAERLAVALVAERAARRAHAVDDRRPHHDAAVRERAGDHRHLHRRRRRGWPARSRCVPGRSAHSGTPGGSFPSARCPRPRAGRSDSRAAGSSRSRASAVRP